MKNSPASFDFSRTVKSIESSLDLLAYEVSRKVARMTDTERTAFMQVLCNADDPVAFDTITRRPQAIVSEFVQD